MGTKSKILTAVIVMLVSEWANYHAVLAVHVVVCNFVMECWVVSGSGASLNVRLAVSGTLTDLIIHHWLLTFLWLWFQLWLWCMWVWPLLGEVFPPFLDGSVHMESWTAVLVYESLRGWWSLLVRLKQAIKCFFFFFLSYLLFNTWKGRSNKICGEKGLGAFFT